MYDDDDHITIGYYHFRGCGWFEMELYLPLLVDCPKNKMPWHPLPIRQGRKVRG